MKIHRTEAGAFVPMEFGAWRSDSPTGSSLKAHAFEFLWRQD